MTGNGRVPPDVNVQNGRLLYFALLPVSNLLAGRRLVKRPFDPRPT